VINLRKFYYDEIVKCLVSYGNITQEDAEKMLTTSSIYPMLTRSDDDIGILDHEIPYYWAMHILYAKEKPDWYQDRNLWPPPDGLNK
jgi:hypothetical protein